jgi:predicted nucleotidyltransferase
MRGSPKSIERRDQKINSHGLNISKRQIAEFCRQWKITELSLFGSVLREDFRRDSDVDILVTFSKDADWKLDDLVEMKEELEKMLRHPVDLVEKHLIETSPNYIRRKHILEHKETIYVA